MKWHKKKQQKECRLISFSYFRILYEYTFSMWSAFGVQCIGKSYIGICRWIRTTKHNDTRILLYMFTSFRCQKLTSERYVSHEISLVKVILAKASPIERTFAPISMKLV